MIFRRKKKIKTDIGVLINEPYMKDGQRCTFLIPDSSVVELIDITDDETMKGYNSVMVICREKE